jgi:hypothetical protein
MESLVPILIAFAFFVLQAVVAGNKKKEVARQQAQKREQPPVYAPRPSTQLPKSPFEQLLEAMREQGAIGEVEEEAIEEPVAETPAPATSNATAAQQMAAADEEQKKAFAVPQKKEHWFLSEPFDAEKAIVYSEIMRPKFNE